jgi:chemotaxis regulatin CheY-phosphate phosphatase CheZ
MPPVPAPAPFTDADYELIAEAVLETARGRWFLGEYARRNRQADTKLVLEAIEKLERSLAPRPEAPEADRMRIDLVEMLNAINRTKSEIAAIHPGDDGGNHFDQASTELDAIVDTTEKATSDILAAAERVQEIGWTLREQGVEASICDLIDSHATAVYMACSFQDITGQRTRKVIEVLRFLEARIDAMIRIWRLDDLEFTQASGNRLVAPQVRGPQETGDRLQQKAVDQLIGNDRRPDVVWREARIDEGRDPRNLGEFDLEDLVVFESSPDTDPVIGKTGMEADRTARNDAPPVTGSQPSPIPASEAAHTGNGRVPEQRETPRKTEETKPEEKTIESLTLTQRMALFG